MFLIMFIEDINDTNEPLNILYKTDCSSYNDIKMSHISYKVNSAEFFEITEIIVKLLYHKHA